MSDTVPRPTEDLSKDPSNPKASRRQERRKQNKSRRNDRPSSSDSSSSDIYRRRRRREKRKKKHRKKRPKSKRRRRHDDYSGYSESSTDSSDREQSRKRKKHKKKSHKRTKSSEEGKEENDAVSSARVDWETKIRQASTQQEETGKATSGGKEQDPEHDMHNQAASRRMVPMTREQYEAEQSKVREVYDPESGRTRLVRGSGEIIERIVAAVRAGLDDPPPIVLFSKGAHLHLESMADSGADALGGGCCPRSSADRL